MDKFRVSAEHRDVRGKGASRRLRRAGKVPGVLYGGEKEALAIELTHNELLLHCEEESFYSQILELLLGGVSEKVVVKDIQRHPFKPFIMHIDFQRIDESESLTIRVPIHFLNEESCAGVKLGGGLVSKIMTELEVTCLPRDLPEAIDVDLAALEVGEAIHLSDLTVPEGVQIASLLHGGDDTLTVVQVVVPRAVAAEDEESEVTESDPEETDQEETGNEGVSEGQ
jgi:large subunit ribosomal protein L25